MLQVLSVSSYPLSYPVNDLPRELKEDKPKKPSKSLFKFARSRKSSLSWSSNTIPQSNQLHPETLSRQSSRASSRSKTTAERHSPVPRSRPATPCPPSIRLNADVETHVSHQEVFFPSTPPRKDFTIKDSMDALRLDWRNGDFIPLRVLTDELPALGGDGSSSSSTTPSSSSTLVTPISFSLPHSSSNTVGFFKMPSSLPPRSDSLPGARNPHHVKARTIEPVRRPIYAPAPLLAPPSQRPTLSTLEIPGSKPQSRRQGTVITTGISSPIVFAPSASEGDAATARQKAKDKKKKRLTGLHHVVVVRPKGHSSSAVVEEKRDVADVMSQLRTLKTRTR